jgi:hypothetical protein
MIRDLGFISWKDPNAWMEKMKGERWDAMVKRENSRFLKEVEKAATKDEILEKKDDFIKATRDVVFSYKNILVKRTEQTEWFYENDTTKCYVVTDVFIYKNLVYHIRDVGKGSEKNRLECLDGHKILWYTNNVGPNVFVKDDKCYYLNVENKLWCNKLISVNYRTGLDKKIIYEETDRKYLLTISIGDNECLFLIRENSGLQNLFVIENDSIVYKNETLQYYSPIGYHESKICYLYSDGSIWRASGFSLHKKFDNEVLYFSLQNKIVVLIEEGLNVMYTLYFKKITSFYGSLIYNKYVDKHFDKFYIDITGAGIHSFSYDKKIVKNESFGYYGRVKSYKCGDVPIVFVEPYSEMKGMILVGYGGYGVATSMKTSRWKPYIDSGWGVGFICVRGSGDVNKRWASSARTYSKNLAFTDFENSIRFLQKKYKISPKDTCIYGRSAGGYLVGSLVSRNPKGHLFKMVYTEVPYVDVLRTTTNPTLPLTSLEYDEFGNPANGIYEFRTIIEYSPVDSLNYTTPPDIFVLIRSSENDSQVFAYESFKWLKALRGDSSSDCNKLLFLTEKAGHFVNGEKMYENFSEDFYLLKSVRDNGK